MREPIQLRRGKAFHKRVQDDWSGTVEDRTVRPEYGIQFDPPDEELAIDPLTGKRARIRRGRIDIFIDEISDFVSVVEIKGTDWDRIKPANRRKLLGAHRRQVLKYVDKYLDQGQVNVCAGIIYPRAPRTPGLKDEVETYLNDHALQVVWYDD